MVIFEQCFYDFLVRENVYQITSDWPIAMIYQNSMVTIGNNNAGNAAYRKEKTKR